jgi:hypothetical protein
MGSAFAQCMNYLKAMNYRCIQINVLDPQTFSVILFSSCYAKWFYKFFNIKQNGFTNSSKIQLSGKNLRILSTFNFN